MIRSSLSIRRICVLLTAMLAFAVIAPAGAFAQSPTDEQYGNGVVGVAGDADSGPSGTTGTPTPTSESTSGIGISQLPFTGLDVAAIAAIGVGLLGAGLLVRRTARAGDKSV